MAWIDLVENDFIITTGDGSEFRPLWGKTSKRKEFNVSQFEFPNQKGTKVDRGTPKGRVYDLEIYFQGEDNIEQAQAFDDASEDPRPWVISHPLYGSIIVQPLGLNFDDTQNNVTKVTGTLVETITDDNPKMTVNATDKILSDKETLDTTFSEAYTNDVQPDVNDINTLTANNVSLYNEGKKSLKTTLDAENYFNAFNTANAAILNATSEPLAAIVALQTAINQPFLFQDSVKNRIDTLTTQFNKLRESLSTITRKSDKHTYENNSAMLVSSMCAASVTEPDYQNRKDVIQIIDIINEVYNQYVLDLDGLQTENGGEEDSYIPDQASAYALNDIVNFTISNLFDVALNAKQERSILLEDDSNAVNLTHRFYPTEFQLGDDSALQKFINDNNIGLNEILQIRKGRKIIYYV